MDKSSRIISSWSKCGFMCWFCRGSDRGLGRDLTHQHQRLSCCDGLAFHTENLLDTAITRGVHGDLHLHGLDHQQRLPGRDWRTNRHLHRPAPPDTCEATTSPSKAWAAAA